MVYIFKSNAGACDNNSTNQVYTQPDISIENPNAAEYDHFGASILRIKDTLLIGAPGFSIDSKQRVGRVYAFDLVSKKLKWTISGTNEFQQFGR
jgi:glycosylphosphatidylinositol phospholipase D